MTVNVVLVVVVLPALTFAAVYFPVLARFSMSLASPYPKADAKRRLFAGGVDASLLLTGLYFYQHSGSAWFALAGVAYSVLRDSMNGRSVGKFLAGLAVLSLETGHACTLRGSVRRNLMFFFPGVNVVAAVLETATALRDPQGHRLGDRLARTQVVEGFGARDLATSFVRWWTKTTGFEGVRRRPGRRVQPARSMTARRSLAGRRSVPQRWAKQD